MGASRQSQLMAIRSPFLSYAIANTATAASNRQRCDPMLAERANYERRLGHRLANCGRARVAAVTMAQKALRYIHVRADRNKGSSIYGLLQGIQRPVALPFAGRAHGTSHLFRILNGEGNVRESLASVWLAMSHLITEDLVGPNRLPDAIQICEDAGLASEGLTEWIRQACLHVYQTTDVDLQDLDAYDLFRLQWHPVRKLQISSRVQFIPEPILAHRIWSTETRHAFSREGGVLSVAEAQLVSPLGRQYLPWMNPQRLFGVNSESDLYRYCENNSIPLATGASGVAVQMLKFGEVMRIDIASLKVGLFGYLMTIRAHSFYEMAISTLGREPPRDMPLDYSSMDA
jgi:hypothetical protein